MRFWGLDSPEDLQPAFCFFKWPFLLFFFRAFWIPQIQNGAMLQHFWESLFTSYGLNQALLAIIRKPFIARKHKASVNPSKKLCMKVQSWVRVWIFGAATSRQLSTCKQKVPGHTTKHVSPLNRHRSILLRASPKCREVCNKSVSLQASNWFNKVSKGWMMKVSTCGKSWRSPEFHGMWKIKQIVTHSEIVYSPIRRRPRRHEFWFILQTPTTHHSSSAKVMCQSDSNYVPPIKAPNMQIFFEVSLACFRDMSKV